VSLPLVLSGWVASEAVGRSVLRALVVLGVALLSFDCLTSEPEFGFVLETAPDVVLLCVHPMILLLFRNKTMCYRRFN